LFAATASTLEAQTAESVELAETIQRRASLLSQSENAETSVETEKGVKAKRWRKQRGIGGRRDMFNGYGRWAGYPMMPPPYGWNAYRYAGSTERRVDCEICTTVVDSLIKRLGDQFSPLTIASEADLLCSRLSWTLRSGCQWITRVNRDVVIALIMKLTEPIDACKHLQLCPPDSWDILYQSGVIEFSKDKRDARMALGGGPLNRRAFTRPGSPSGRLNGQMGGGFGPGLGLDDLAAGGFYAAMRDESTILPPAFASVS
jgi:hypothetical protein